MPHASDDAPPKRKPGRPPGFKGTPNRDFDYRCAECGATPGRDNLIAKRVVYATVARPTRTIKSRTVKWLCQPCAEKEPEWAQRSLADAPGMKGTKSAES